MREKQQTLEVNPVEIDASKQMTFIEREKACLEASQVSFIKGKSFSVH